MAKLKKCEICGAEFETNRPNKKFCSLSCREAGRLVARMKWEERNPGYITDYMQKYRKAAKNG